MMKKVLGAAALAVSMVGGAQAAALTMGPGATAVFNFSGWADSTSLRLMGFSTEQGETASITYYTGHNLAGTVAYTDLAPSRMTAEDELSNSALRDGFSVHIQVFHIGFVIDPVAVYFNEFGIPMAEQAGTLGNTSGLTPPPPPPVDPNPPPTSNVPEPGSLALVAMAGLGLAAAQQRRRRQG